MKTCDYCGKTNEDVSQFCAGCGTPFPDPTAKIEPAPWTRLRDSMPSLNAISATFILFAWFITAVFCATFTRGLASLILPLVFSGSVMILTSISLIPESLSNTNPTGAAWVAGPPNAIVKGLLIGLILGMCGHFLILISKHPLAHRHIDPIDRLLCMRGITRWLTLAASVFLAPPVEEMLFRGVLYGGYRKSFGPFWGATVPTLLFVAGHFPFFIDVPLTVFAYLGLALATLWCRLRWSAIAPAIAVHMAYNALLGLFVIFRI